MSNRIAAALALATAGLFAASSLLASEPESAVVEVSLQCEALGPDEARSVGDALMVQGDYQRAGQCYLSAGQYDLANRAFLRAARPTAAATGRAIVEQREAPRALFNQVKRAFHANH